MRAEYIGWDPALKGRIGNCAPASGHDDPESIEEGAYFFQADGDEDAAYVDPETDLQILSA